MPLEGSGREVSQWGNVLGLPLSSLRTGGNLVFCSVPEICHWGQVVDYLWCESAIWYLAPLQECADGCMVCAQAS